MSVEVGSLFARIGADTSSYDQAMRRVRSSMTATGSSLMTASRAASAAGSTITRGFTLPLVAGLAYAVHSAAEFDATVNTLGVATNASAAQMRAMRAEAIRLGADIKLPGTSASDAAQAMLELGKAGMNANQVMAAARGVLVASAAGQISNAEAADLTAGALNAFGLAAGQAARVANTLAGGANASTADMRGLGYGLAAVGQSAHAAHMTLEQTVAALAEMANKGIPAADAGVAMKVMLQSLTPSSKKAAAAMRELGVNVYDSHHRMLPFLDIVDQFHRGMAKLTEQQRNQALQTIFGTHAINAARVVFGDGARELARMTGEVGKQGQAARMASAENKGLKGAIDGLVSTAQTVAVQLGEMLAPAVEAIASGVQRAVAWFQNLSGPVKNAIGIVVASIALVGPALMVFGAVLAVLASPIMLIVGAIGLLAGALYYLYQTSPAVRAALQEIGQYIQANLPAAIAFAKQAFHTLAADVRSAVEAVANVVKTVWGSQVGQFIRTESSQIAASVKQNWGTIKQTIVAAISDIRAAVQTGMSVIKAVWNWGPMQTIVAGAWAAMKAIIVASIGVISGVLETASALIRGDWGAAWGGLKDTVSAALTGVKAVVSSSLTTIATLAVAGATAVAHAIESGVKKAPGMLAGLAGDLMSRIGPALEQAAGQAAGEAVHIGAQIVSGVLSGLGSLESSVKSKIESSISSVLSHINIPGFSPPDHAAAEAIGHPLARGVIQGFLDGTANLPSKISDRLRQALEHAKTVLDSQRSALQSAFERMGSDALAAFDAKTQALLDAAAGKVSAENDKIQKEIDDTKSGLQESLQKWQDYYDGIAAAAKQAADDQLAAQMKAIQATQDALTPAEQALKDAQGQHDEQGRQDAIRKAQQDLAAAQNANDPAGIVAAQQALDNALYEEKIAALEQQAQAERAARDAAAEQQKADAQAAHDAQVAQIQAQHDADLAAVQASEQAKTDAIVANLEKIQTALAKDAARQQKDLAAQRAVKRQNLEDELNDLETYLEKHPTAWKKTHAAIMKLFQTDFGPDFREAGKNMGLAWEQGIRDAFSGVESVVTKLAQLIAHYLQLHSPAKKGPLSTLDTWFKPFAPTLLSGLDMASVEKAVDGVTGTSSTLTLAAGSLGVPAGGTVHVYNINVEGSVVTEDELTEKVRTGLIQKARANGSAIGGLA